MVASVPFRRGDLSVDFFSDAISRVKEVTPPVVEVCYYYN
jgi:hypothetical protein